MLWAIKKIYLNINCKFSKFSNQITKFDYWYDKVKPEKRFCILPRLNPYKSEILFCLFQFSNFVKPTSALYQQHFKWTIKIIKNKSTRILIYLNSVFKLEHIALVFMHAKKEDHQLNYCRMKLTNKAKSSEFHNSYHC